MQSKIKIEQLEIYSTWFLFYLYKQEKDDKILNEIFLRTYSDIYDSIKSRVGLRDDPMNLVMIVYTIMKKILQKDDPIENVESYLEKIVDGCLIIYSN